MTPREAIANCLADVEEHPEPEHYDLADDVLLALKNAGYRLFRDVSPEEEAANGAAAERDRVIRLAKDRAATCIRRNGAGEMVGVMSFADLLAEDPS